MSIRVDLEADLDRLERDRAFQEDVRALKPGRYAWGQGREGLPAYRRYSRVIEPYVESPDTMRAILSEPLLKIWFFRVFGYLGELRFTLRHTAWLRELPLLDIGRDAHLGFGMILGTSRVTPDGAALVLAPIRIGARAVFHQHAVMEGGSIVGDDCRVGIRALIGAGARVGEGASIGDFVRLGDGAQIGAGAEIAAGASIGAHSVVDPGMRLAENESIPDHHRLTRGGLFPMPHRRMAA